MVAKKILVTGGTGMVGSYYKDFNSEHDFLLLGSKSYDLTNSSETYFMIRDHRPDAIIHLAARVGGVKGNTDFVADFFKDNILINTNVLTSAAELGVKKVISLLSTCVYPDEAEYPFTPDQFHNGPPHKSNFGYAYSKRMVDVYS
jgi:GDP-L-fucose synthase